MWIAAGIAAYLLLATAIWAVIRGGTRGAEHDERQHDEHFERVYRHNKARMARRRHI